MRRIAVLLVLGAATCRPDAAPVDNGPWLDLGPAPSAPGSNYTLGPVTARPPAIRPMRADPFAPRGPSALEPIGHTGLPPQRAPMVVLPQDAVVAAHGPRTLPYAVWPTTRTRPTVTAWFLRPQQVLTARQTLDEGCTGDKPRSVTVGDDIRLDRAFPYKFGAACLELSLDGYPTARSVVQSTDLSVSARYDLDAIHVLVTSMRTGNPVAADLRLFGAGAPVWSGTTDAGGSAALPGVRGLRPGVTQHIPLTLVVSAGEDFVSTVLAASDEDTYLGAYAGLSPAPRVRLDAHITTGRDHFFAGETVVVQGLVRGVSPGAVDAVPDRPIRWSATAFDGEPLVTDARAELEDGGFQVRCDLPAGVAPGPLRFRFVVATTELGHTVEVIEDEPGVTAMVTGSGLSLQVLASEDVPVQIHARAIPTAPPSVPGWHTGPADLGAYVPATSPRRETQELAEMDGRSGPDVPWRLTLPPPTGPGPWEIEVDVTVGGERALRLKHRSRVDADMQYGLDAPAAAPAGPCPALKGARIEGTKVSPMPVRLTGPDQRETNDCTTAGDYRVEVGQTARWMLMYGDAAPPRPLIVPVDDGLVIGVPRAGWRGLLTLERGGIVFARPLASPTAWTHVALPDLGRWAPGVTAVVTLPRSQRDEPATVTRALPIDDSPFRLPVEITAQTDTNEIRGVVNTAAGSQVQVLCVDAASNAAQRPRDGPLARFRHPWSEATLSALTRAPSAEIQAAAASTKALPAPSLTEPFANTNVARPAIGSTGHTGTATRGKFAFACPTPRSGRIAVLAQASMEDKFGSGRSEFSVTTPVAVPTPLSTAPSVGASLPVGPTSAARVDTVTDGAEALEIVVGNSALTAIVEPLRALLAGDDTVAGATGRLVALSAAKEIIPHLGAPGLDSPAAVHDATRQAIRGVLRHQRDDGSFGSPRDSVDATMALLLARESGAWVSPRPLETALRHLHRFHLIVPDGAPDRDTVVWRAWLARRLSGADDPVPKAPPGGPDALFLTAREGGTDLDPGPLASARGSHGLWNEDGLWAVVAWAQYARAVPRPPGEARVWVGERGAVRVAFRGKTPEFQRALIPVAVAGKDPQIVVSGPTNTWATLSLTLP